LVVPQRLAPAEQLRTGRLSCDQGDAEPADRLLDQVGGLLTMSSTKPSSSASTGSSVSSCVSYKTLLRPGTQVSWRIVQREV
jgi:hypothetical protein